MSFSAASSGKQKTLAMRPCQTFKGHTKWVWDVIHLPGGQRIMTCSSDGSLRVWNLKTGEQIGDAWRDGGDPVATIALSLDGKKVVCGCDDGAVELWDIDTGKVIAKWTGHTNWVTSVCWNRDGGRVMSGSEDGTARVWDVESGKTILAIETGLKSVHVVIYSPGMTMIGTGGINREENEFLKIWDVKTGKLIANLKGYRGAVTCLAWTADGSMLISGSIDSSIRTWNTTTWHQVHVLTGHTYVVHAIAISPNGLILASASWDDTVRLWNLENGLPIGLPLQHPTCVQCVSFSTDGRLLATGCWDRNAYSWGIFGILREAGLLNPTDDDKSLIDADATRRPGHRRRDVHRIPPKFFDDSPHHSLPSIAHHLSSSSAHHHNVTAHPSSHRRAQLGRLSSLFQRDNDNTHDTPRLHFLELARSTFVHLSRGRNNEGVELQERPLAVVNVPFTRGKPRNYSVGELRRKEEKEKQKAKNAKNAQSTQNAMDVSAGSSRPAQSSAAQQSGGAAQVQASSEVHATLSTLSTTRAIVDTPAATAPASLPDAVIPRAGRWTRFWLFIGCVPAQYTDGHH